MTDWSEVPLEVLLSDKKNAIAMGPFGSRIKAENFVSEGVPVIKGGNLNGAFLDETDFDFLKEEKAEELKSSKAIAGDIIITHRGTIGQVGLIRKNSKYTEYIVSQSQLKFTPSKSKLDSTFAYYFLKSPLGQHRLLMNSSQVGVPAIAKATTSVKEILFPHPPLSDQKAIANILSTLDDKIELNQKMNQTIEDITKAIFKSWFVDFDPVRAKIESRPTDLPPEISDLFPAEFVNSEIGEIPKGWNIKPLDQIGNFRNGLALQKYPAKDGEEHFPVVKIAQLRKGSTIGDDLFASSVPSDFLINDGDYIFSWSGSLMAKYWVGGRGALNQHLFKVEEKSHPLWFIAGWVEHHMPEFQSIAESKATTMGHIKREHLKQALCAIPHQELIDRAAIEVTPLIKRSILSQQESKVLYELRDTLLPKLISGELRITDAEKFLEGVNI
ncbi:restriction endonuclease subunit S [Alphaproteobacteria bacterium]|nr:restriction endonuclease subunit S [Alphaproteobacteria bacterium]